MTKFHEYALSAKAVAGTVIATAASSISQMWGLIPSDIGKTGVLFGLILVLMQINLSRKQARKTDLENRILEIKLKKEGGE